MVDLQLLQRLIGESNFSKKDLSQESFDKIASLIEKDQMEKATELMTAIFSEGNLDFRIVFYYFYAHFLNHGIKSLKETFPILESLLSTHQESLRPFHRKEKQLESSFNWFFSHLLNKLKYHERLAKAGKTAPLWDQSTTQLSEKEFEEIFNVVKSFESFFYAKWSQSLAKERVSHLVKKIEDFKPFVQQQQEVIIEKIIEPTPVATPPWLETKVLIKENFDDSFQSEEMKRLIKKLKIFELLIEQKQHLKAALVSKDITGLIDHFDPCLYFPKLFSRFFTLSARHTSTLSKESKEPESNQWKALEKLYKIDIDQFITLEHDDK